MMHFSAELSGQAQPKPKRGAQKSGGAADQNYRATLRLL